MNQEKTVSDEEEFIEESTIHQLSPPTVGRNHGWIQQGPYLNYFKCDSPHGINIGINKIFKGYTKEGTLKIEDK